MNKVHLLESYFDFFYAKAMILEMGSLNKKWCLGCQQGKLSQLDHTCLLSKKEQLDTHFDQIVNCVNEEEVIFQWRGTARSLVDEEVIDMYYLKLSCKDWIETMKTDKWTKKMKSLILSVLSLKM